MGRRNVLAVMRESMGPRYLGQRVDLLTDAVLLNLVATCRHNALRLHARRLGTSLSALRRDFEAGNTDLDTSKVFEDAVALRENEDYHWLFNELGDRRLLGPEYEDDESREKNHPQTQGHGLGGR